MIVRPYAASFTVSVKPGVPADVEALIVCVGRIASEDDRRNGKKPPLRAPDLPKPLATALTRAVEAGLFKAEPGETHVQESGQRRPRFLIWAGLGNNGVYTPDRLRLAVGAGLRRAGTLAVKTAGAVYPAGIDAGPAARAAAEGAVLSTYTYAYFKTRKESPRARLASFVLGVAGRGTATATRGAEAGVTIAEAQCFARDLCHGPANEMTPETLAKSAAGWARAKGLACRVLDDRAIRRLGMGALWGVGQGSANPPRLVILEHRPKGTAARKAPLLFVGKGVTFDTGGISIKPSAQMHHMKGDMGGGAAVVAALGACAALKVPYPVVGLVPFVENMPDGKAQRPGDIVKSLAGLTIEVLNTDAEGRLALADAIAYGHRYKPSAIVDIATLTGACAQALGKYAAGLFTEDEGLLEAIKAAAARSGEKIWPMPIWEEYKKSMDSPVADLQNISGMPQAGATTAAVFLSRFATPYRWAHIDMAGPMWSDDPSPLSVKGPTGYGARLLTQIALDWTGGNGRKK